MKTMTLEQVKALWEKNRDAVEYQHGSAVSTMIDFLFEHPEKVAAFKPGQTLVYPNGGLWWFLHHGVLLEKTDNVLERIDYVKDDKDAHELEVRFRAMRPVKNFDALPEELKATMLASFSRESWSLGMLKHHWNGKEYCNIGTQVLAQYLAEYPENADIVDEDGELIFPDYSNWHDVHEGYNRAALIESLSHLLPVV